jgi:hypothetical protein
MSQEPKSAQLQIRVSSEEKKAIQRAAERAGMGMSAYVLSRVLSASAARFQECVTACADHGASSFALAELNSLLSALTPREMRDATASPTGSMTGSKDVPFLELDHLRVMVAQPTYLLAMKCLAMRIGAEFHDEEDVRYLLRHLDIRTYDAAVSIIKKYHPLDLFSQKTLYALAKLLPRRK